MPSLALDRIELRDRYFSQTDFALRAAAVPEAPPVFAGHAAVFNSRTAIGNPLTWGFYEEIASGAFAKTLREGDARFLVDHNPAFLVGRVSAGNLRLNEDGVGLAVEADLNVRKSYVADLLENLQDRSLDGMSFGFRVVKDDWNTEQVATSDGQEADVEVRTIREVELFEVSAVTFPAYDETDAALRAVSFRPDPDPLGRRATILSSEPGESTRDDSSNNQPAETTGTALSILQRRHALKARQYDLTA